MMAIPLPCPNCGVAIIPTLKRCACPGEPHPLMIVYRCTACGVLGMQDADDVYYPYTLGFGAGVGIYAPGLPMNN